MYKSFFKRFIDFWITILKVLKRDGISQEGNATMEAFNGRN